MLNAAYLGVRAMKLLLSFIAAIILPALMISAWYLYGQFQVFDVNDPYIWVRTGKFVVSSLWVSGGFVLLLGLPAFLILRWAKAVKWWSTVGTGFLLGAIPAAIFSWPVHSERNFSASVNGVPTIIDGVPTLEGWLQFTYGAVLLGFLGAAGAMAFWLVWRREP